MSNQIHGQVLVPGQTTRWEPIAASLQPNGEYWLKVDTELVLDSGNINISNMKIGSVDQTSNTLRYLKTLDDGTLVMVSADNDPFATFKVSRTIDSGPFPRYYGLTDEEANWIIIEESKIGAEKIYKYISDNSDFLVSWGNRAVLPYNEYSDEF